MKLKLSVAAILFACGTSALAADTSANTNAPLIIIGTNKVANSASETNRPVGPPRALTNPFTNSADMLLIEAAGMWVGKYDVTQKEFQKVMGFNPSAFPGPTRPVDSVSWNDAMSFCEKLTQADFKEMLLPVGYYYTLPTEDEWETLVADASLDDAVTSASGDRDGTAPVGSMKPNSLGLYDMRGNVLQWTLGDDSKAYRVLRGGSWQDRIEINLRTVFRNYEPPDARQNTFGFRVVLKKH